MPRYIDADALIHEYYKTPTYPNLCTAINNAPTADVVERKRGKWINVFVDGLGFNGLEFECSECGKRSAGRTNFCPYCGAEMCK